MGYTFSRTEQRSVPNILRMLDCELPYPYRTESFRYVTLVREALGARLAELEIDGVPEHVYERFVWKQNRPGYLDHPGLAGLVCRAVCWMYCARHYRLKGDIQMAQLNESKVNICHARLREDWGISW